VEQERAAGWRYEHRYGFLSAAGGHLRFSDPAGKEPLVNLDTLHALGVCDRPEHLEGDGRSRCGPWQRGRLHDGCDIQHRRSARRATEGKLLGANRYGRRAFAGRGLSRQPALGVRGRSMRTVRRFEDAKLPGVHRGAGECRHASPECKFHIRHEKLLRLLSFGRARQLRRLDYFLYPIILRRISFGLRGRADAERCGRNSGDPRTDSGRKRQLQQPESRERQFKRAAMGRLFRRGR